MGLVNLLRDRTGGAIDRVGGKCVRVDEGIDEGIDDGIDVVMYGTIG
jgi:hypothetical protein